VFDTGVRKPLKSFKADYNQVTKKVDLDWEYNQSIGLYFVIYRSYNNGDFTVYKSVDGDRRSYSDGELVGNGKYQYAIMAVFKDGGQSPLCERISLTVETKKSEEK
jgi:hypothetical protein